MGYINENIENINENIHGLGAKGPVSSSQPVGAALRHCRHILLKK